MPTKKMLQDENRVLKAEAQQKDNRIRDLSAEVRNLKTELIREKATSLDLRIRHGENIPNLQPQVKMVSLKLPADAERAGVRFNLQPKVDIKKYKIPKNKDEHQGNEAQTDAADDLYVDSAGPSGCNAKKPNQRTKRQSSDAQLQKTKKQRQNQIVLDVHDDPDDDQDQALNREGRLEDDLYLSTSSSGGSSESQTSSDSSKKSLSSETDNSDGSLSESSGPSASYGTMKPKEPSNRDLPTLQSEDNETEAANNDCSLDSVQLLDSMIMFDSCAFCDGPMPCACQE